ncbi:mitochondrial carrier domain-containing protein [Aspergillus foveolatus]|uniref:mitochondrial carrier domain-containing protein n=1 Tax=Aspergillus foveolatus TaxID=210207 RepID=UPI003CCD82F7
MKNSSPSPWQSILAGAAAGGFESLLTYPAEYLKTRQQSQATAAGVRISPRRLLTTTIRQHGLSHMKSGVQFFTFETARQLMPTDSSGRSTAWGNMGAGMIAGAAESILVVTPGETLKTKIIDDQTGAKRYTSSTHAIRPAVATEGVAGLYRGVVPVTLKQSANAMVRFTSYNFFLRHLQAMSGPDSNNSVIEATVVAGVLAELQDLDGRQRYSGTLYCLRSIISSEGVAVLWRGTTPRLARLSISGAVSFAIYESVMQWTWSLRSPSVQVF